MPVQIPLVNALNQFALVDDEDAERVRLHTWKRMPSGLSVTGYVYTTTKTAGEWQVILLHRFILGLSVGDSRIIDHCNRDRADCRKENLRIATSSGNKANSGLSSRSTSGLKGVSWDRRGKKWRSTITWERTTYHLGYYMQKAHAGYAYNLAASRLHGEYASLNDLQEPIPEEVCLRIALRVSGHLTKSFRKKQ